MNIAVIFAGGVGSRMNSTDRPKQFLMVHGKPIIVHTLEIFQNHPLIDGIIVVCVEGWIDYMEELKYHYRLDKIGKVVPGGETGQLSIYNGLKTAADIYGVDDNIVLIHDGVRPLVGEETITANIESVKEFGSAITSVPAQETVIIVDGNEEVQEIVDRSSARLARAPQSFFLKEVLACQEEAIAQGLTNMTDTCTLMKHFNKKLVTIPGERNNIKITTPEDFYMFRALSDAKENLQLDIKTKKLN